MKIGKTEQYINKKIKEEGAILSVIIDPCDHGSSESAIETGIAAFKSGADIVAVGGSIGAQGALLDKVVKGIKEKIDVPVVLFPGNIATICSYADAIYFMSLLNSRNSYWISQAQTLSAPLIKEIGIEPLPMGYIIVEPGGTAGWVGDVNLIPRNNPKIAAAVALGGQFSGQRIIFTDAGSAAFAHIPLEMIQLVGKTIDVPYLVGGGIKNALQAGKVIEAGADWVQIGTAVEKKKEVKKIINGFVKVIKQKGKNKIKK